MRATIDVSMCINDLLARMHVCTDPRRLEVMVSQLAFAIQTVTQRRFDHVEVGCRISGIEPLFQALHGGFPHANASPETVSKIRLDALDTLENLARPWMWDLVPEFERQTLEYALDHLVLVEQSRQEVALARQQMHSDGPLKVREEVLFLQGLFSRRDAYLTVNYASLLWGCLRDFYQRMGNANTSSLQKAYDVVQRLLEGQLIARGLEPVSWHPEEGAAYQLPRTGEVVFLRRRTPQVEVYASLRSVEPSAVYDAWFDVLEWATQRMRQSNGAS
ncbi:MAG: hypothetical protein R3E66_04855 [bacterium]